MFYLDEVLNRRSHSFIESPHVWTATPQTVKLTVLNLTWNLQIESSVECLNFSLQSQYRQMTAVCNPLKRTLQTHEGVAIF